MVVIIDYNIGNLSSVASALKRIGIEAVISRDKKIIKQAKAIVLPGVGTFLVAMNNLKKYDLIDVLNECKDKGTPIFPQAKVLLSGNDSFNIRFVNVVVVVFPFEPVITMMGASEMR